LQFIIYAHDVESPLARWCLVTQAIAGKREGFVGEKIESANGGVSDAGRKTQGVSPVFRPGLPA
jgi:hypothetical protein